MGTKANSVKKKAKPRNKKLIQPKKTNKLKYWSRLLLYGLALAVVILILVLTIIIAGLDLRK